jgi:hypothetical protein
VLVEEGRELGEDLHVLAHLGPDPGTLHLHDHLASVAQGRTMNLPEGRGRERCGVEGRKDLGDPHLELPADDVLDLVEREWRDLVLEPRQRLDVRRAQQVHAGGHQLAELDERGPHGFQVRGQSRGGVGVPLQDLAVQHGVEARGTHQVPVTVPDHE